MSNNKLLIICYSFPPHPGIGGRRWAKFSKELVNNSYKIFVVNAKNINESESLWLKDVIVPEIRLFSFSFKFQRAIKNPSSLIYKIFRKIILKYYNQTKYIPDIITSFPNKQIWKDVENIIIDNEIQKVIVSGDPFLFYQASLLKKKLAFELILDYRDLWNDHSFYGVNIKLNQKQKQYFEFAENFAVNNCDKILFVDEGLEAIVKKRVNNLKVQTNVLSNGFDPDDFKDAIINKEKRNDKINIFFSGNISSDVNEIFFNFLSAFKNLQTINPVLYNRFNIEITGAIDEVLINFIKQLDLKQLKFKKSFLSFDAYKQFCSTKDIGIIHLSKEYPHSFATKFGDFLSLDIFTLSIGYRGDFASYIESNKIGIHYDLDAGAAFFEKMETEFNNREKPTTEILNQFNLKTLTKKLIQILYHA